jgi:hypothetical protein
MPPEPEPAQCMEDQAAFAVGQTWTPELAEAARIAAGAEVQRTIRPGDAVTMDFRTDRLNLHLNATDTIVEVDCS